jgi:hypothetical protein
MEQASLANSQSACTRASSFELHSNPDSQRLAFVISRLHQGQQHCTSQRCKAAQVANQARWEIK